MILSNHLITFLFSFHPDIFMHGRQAKVSKMWKTLARRCLIIQSHFFFFFINGDCEFSGCRWILKAVMDHLLPIFQLPERVTEKQESADTPITGLNSENPSQIFVTHNGASLPCNY